jgi:hypothetical protein
VSATPFSGKVCWENAPTAIRCSEAIHPSRVKKDVFLIADILKSLIMKATNRQDKEHRI